MLGENILLTWFEYQRFNRTTKVDTIHSVYILVIVRALFLVFNTFHFNALHVLH